MQKEIFDPVLPITTFSPLDEAIAMANSCEYWLTSLMFILSPDEFLQTRVVYLNYKLQLIPRVSFYS